MLEVRHLSAAYGQHPALQDASLNVNKGEIVVILGANGAGKSTLLRSIAGVCEGRVSGEILLSGKPLNGLTADEIVESGVALVPEGRGIFGDLTVKENLLLGAYSARARASEQQNLQQVLSLFPKLGERQSQIARTMSGGEQQMVAIGRAMMSAPDILMLDEPSLGLAPLLCTELFQNLQQVKALDIGILLVEQNARQSRAIADRGYLLENTRITHEDNAASLATDPAVQKAYLGAGVAEAGVGGDQTKATTEDSSIPSSTAFASSTGEIRRSADQQIGLSIDDMVSQAAQISAQSTQTETHAVEKPPSLTHSQSSSKRVHSKATAVATPVSVSNSQIERITHDIEQAAQQARRRATARATRSHRTSRTRPNTENDRTSSSRETTDDASPPVIEIYKRPRVEVYRRRPGGEFERD